MKIFGTVFTCLLLKVTYSQTILPPDLTDPNWIPVVAMTDEFNDGVIDNTKWDWSPPWGSLHGQVASSQACLTNSTNNRIESGGSLKLIVTQETNTCYSWDGTPYTRPYKAGALYSNNTIKYGYFEIKIRIPDYNTNNTEGFGPNFWFWKLLDPLDGKWSEIDVFEFDAINNKHTCNVHYHSEYISPVVPPSSHWAMRNSADDIPNVNFNNQWHVFSCEWTPEYIRFFMDGNYIVGTTAYCADQLFLNMIIDINVPAVNFNRFSIPSGALIPYTYEIDYVRTYQRQMDCSTHEIVCTLVPANLLAVKKSITFQNSCGITVPTGNHKFYASDFIQINGDFTVMPGRELLLDTQVCY